MKKELRTNRSVLLVISNIKYSSYIVKVASYLSDISHEVCYVSLNKLYPPLVKKLKDAKVDTSSFTFIDGVTMTALSDPVKTKNCTYIPGPNALDDLDLAIVRTSLEKGIDALLLDTISTIDLFEKNATITRFIRGLITKMNSLHVKCVFTCLKDDTDKGLIKSLSKCVDKVVTVK